MRSSLIAGVLAGIAGMLTFLIVHHLLIRPIWFILPFGLLMACLGGLAVGWAHHELKPALPGRPWSTLAMMGLVMSMLLPSIVLAEIRSPLFDVSAAPEAVLTVSVGRAVAVYTAELLLTTIVLGAVLGWIIGRTRAASIATALAGLAFAVGPGHNVPLLGGTFASVKGTAILVIIIAVSAIVLVEAERQLHRADEHKWPSNLISIGREN